MIRQTGLPNAEAIPGPVTSGPIPALTFTPRGDSTDWDADDAAGFRFTIGAGNVTVSRLGFYDAGTPTATMSGSMTSLPKPWLLRQPFRPAPQPH